MKVVLSLPGFEKVAIGGLVSHGSIGVLFLCVWVCVVYVLLWSSADAFWSRGALDSVVVTRDRQIAANKQTPQGFNKVNNDLRTKFLSALALFANITILPT